MSDFLLVENGDGGDFVLDHDIKIDSSFYTAIYISLFTGISFYNAFVDYPTNEEFEKSLNAVVTAPNLRIVESKANIALEWMVSVGLAKSIDISAFGDSSGKINVDITIVEPNNLATKFSVIWQNEKYILKGYN